MSDETGYQGWRNYETWAVALWLDNEQGSYNYCNDQAREYLTAEADAYELVTGEDGEEIRRAATSALAHLLEQEHQDGSPLADADASIYSDLLGAALSAVDWYEVAAHYVDDQADDVIAEHNGEQVA